MAQEVETPAERTTVGDHRLTWRSGVAAGLLGGAAMGLLMSLVMRPVIAGAIPALVGLSGGLAGWAVHMSIGAVLGVTFVALVTLTPVGDVAEDLTALVGVGLAYGVVAAGVVMPLWLAAVGFPDAPAVPNLAPTSLAAHAVYGTALGATLGYV